MAGRRERLTGRIQLLLQGRRLRRALALLVAAVACAAPLAAAAEVLRPRVVIVAYFEDTPLNGEAATPRAWGAGPARRGELIRWVERLELTRRVPLVGAFNPAWTNADGSILALKVGPNALHPAVNVTALGLDPNLDLRQSYWLFTGIAGASPSAAALGDAVWTDFVIDGDAAHEIDAREIPADWPTGYIPPGKTRPYEQPRVPAGGPTDVRTWTDAFTTSPSRNVIALNRGLARWAFASSRGAALQDDPAMRELRSAYIGVPTAQGGPSVRMGATLASETFWHGARLDQWARDWTSYMTDGVGRYVTTQTNDSGAMTAIAALARAGRADANRVLLLRTVSNFDMPPPGVTAAQGLADHGPGAYAAHDAALENAWTAGAPVVKALLARDPALPPPAAAP